MNLEGGQSGYKPSAREYVNLVSQFNEEYATVVGLYLWRVDNGIISSDPRFEELCPDIGHILVSPTDLGKVLNNIDPVQNHLPTSATASSTTTPRRTT